jgi:hypothetical protein
MVSYIAVQFISQTISKYMTTITNTAISESRKNNVLVGRMMIAFNKTQNTILNWFDSKNPILTTPDAVRIIREETGLDDSQILEEEVKEGTNVQ